MSKKVSDWRRFRRVTILASLLVLAIMAVGGPSTKASAAAFQQPYAPADASGTGVNAPPRGSQPLAPGLWDAQNYEMPLPAKACPQPPQNLAARLALVNFPTVLSYYGLPPLSQYSGDLAKWQKVIGSMRHNDCQESRPIHNGKPMVNGNIGYNKLWGGFGNHHLGATDHYGGDGYFTMPSVSSTTGGLQAVSAWVGVGGTDKDALDQAGWEALATSSGTTYNWFYEYVPPPGGGAGATTIAGSFNVNDTLYFYCNYTGGYTLIDTITGDYHSGGIGYNSSKESVEFIMERIGGAGGTPLANFGSPFFDNVEWENTSYNWDDLINNGYEYQWVLQNWPGSYMIVYPDWPKVNPTPPGDYFQSDWVCCCDS